MCSAMCMQTGIDFLVALQLLEVPHWQSKMSQKHPVYSQ